MEFWTDMLQKFSIYLRLAYWAKAMIIFRLWFRNYLALFFNFAGFIMNTLEILLFKFFKLFKTEQVFSVCLKHWCPSRCTNIHKMQVIQLFAILTSDLHFSQSCRVLLFNPKHLFIYLNILTSVLDDSWY